MNILKLFPKRLRESYEKNLVNAGIKTDVKKYVARAMFFGLLISFVVSLVLSFLKISPILSFLLTFFIIQTGLYMRVSLKATSRIKKMEDVFPDFIQLMSSNLRAGMTLDRAFLFSARPELAPLDEEISKTGREIATGQDMMEAFKNMADRINSDKINKTVYLIISGLKAGGNISTLLETTASNMREKEFLEKRAASNVLMYVIFIAISIGIGAPVLFGLSSILIQIIINLTTHLPTLQSTQMSLPFVLSSIGLTPNFVIYFSVIFLIVTDFISSLVIGLVSKGDERYGFKYIIPLMALSISIFFIIRLLLFRFLSDTFSAIS